jgi:hypothetical protein
VTATDADRSPVEAAFRTEQVPVRITSDGNWRNTELLIEGRPINATSVKFQIDCEDPHNECATLTVRTWDEPFVFDGLAKVVIICEPKHTIHLFNHVDNARSGTCETCGETVDGFNPS